MLMYVFEAGKPTVLWLASDAQDTMMVQHLIQLDDIADQPAKDGTTAMAVALGRRNPEIVQLLLMRFLGGESGHNSEYLTQEYLKDTHLISKGDEEYEDVTKVRNAIIDVIGVSDQDLQKEQGNEDVLKRDAM